MSDSKNPSIAPRERPAGGESVNTQFVAGAGFALIYALMQRYQPLSALAVLALLPCILWRLQDPQRRIVQAPLTFAALMLAFKIFTLQAGNALDAYAYSRGLPLGHLAAPWMPLFLAVSLFYLPDGTSYSRKAFLGLGILLLCSGLLPAAGFALIFSALEYLLFFAVAVAIGMDLLSGSQPKTVPARS